MVVASTRPSRILISQAAVEHNITAIREAAKANEIFLAVKANAYGFGIIQMAKVAVAGGIDGLAVAVLDEALALREAGITIPIIILGITMPEYAQMIADNDIIATVSSLEWLQTVQSSLTGNKQLLVSLAVDTGMGRIGIRSRSELSTSIDFITEHSEQFVYQGLMTHFSEADSTKTAYFKKQLIAWHDLTDGLPQPPMVHVANSGAAMYHADEIPTDVIRAGTVVYGIEPSRGEVMADDYLEPVLTLESKLVFVKQMHEGDGISYGHDYRTHEGEWIGTLPIGYADGLPRNLEGFKVLVDGERCPLVGQLAMDQLMISLPHEFPVGTTVTFIGKNGSDEITLEEMAQYIEKAPWEITTGLQERLAREITD